MLEIRERYADGEARVFLGEEYGISQSQLSKIIRGVDWKHVGGPVFEKAPRRDSERVRRGESSHRSKLTKEDVLSIRACCDSGEATISEMSRKYGVTIQAVSSIVHRRTWRHM